MVHLILADGGGGGGWESTFSCGTEGGRARTVKLLVGVLHSHIRETRAAPFARTSLRSVLAQARLWGTLGWCPDKKLLVRILHSHICQTRADMGHPLRRALKKSCWLGFFIPTSAKPGQRRSRAPPCGRYLLGPGCGAPVVSCPDAKERDPIRCSLFPVFSTAAPACARLLFRRGGRRGSNAARRGPPGDSPLPRGRSTAWLR